ncbi:MAG: hypothetical protein Q3966_01330 [Neisseria sp.]|nr:hypothetical protein [Neisseria sp.]
MNNTAQPADSRLQGYIDYPVKRQIAHIDPRLDAYWQENLVKLFAQLDPQQQEEAEAQLLKPKQISRDSGNNTFFFTGRPADFPEYVKSIAFPQLQQLAMRANEYFELLKENDDALEIADLLENTLAIIDRANVGDEPDILAAKHKMRAEFIYSAAKLINEKQTLILPKNRRSLSMEMVKLFISEIYLKHELLDYWFNTLRPYEVEAMSHALLHTYLPQEQKIRQLEVVQTSKYLFAIAPTPDKSQNPFSLRRFLYEEKIFESTRIYLNAAIIDLDHLDNTGHNNIFKAQMECIVTLEGSVNQIIIDLMERLGKVHEAELVPLLQAPFDGASLNVEEAVARRVQEYGEKLEEQILQPFVYAINHTVSHQDEFDYLYVSMRRLFGNILQAYSLFMRRPAVLLNQAATDMNSKLASYPLLMDKRRDKVFTRMTLDERDEADKTLQTVFERLQSSIKQQAANYKKAVEKVKIQQDKYNKPATLADKLFNRKEKQQAELKQLRQEAETLMAESYIDILYEPKNNPDCMVYLEQESTVEINTKERNYAFCAGQDGLGKLPILLTLPQKRTSFDLSEFNRRLQSEQVLDKA